MSTSGGLRSLSEAPLKSQTANTRTLDTSRTIAATSRNRNRGSCTKERSDAPVDEGFGALLVAMLPLLCARWFAGFHAREIAAEPSRGWFQVLQQHRRARGVPLPPVPAAAAKCHQRLVPPSRSSVNSPRPPNASTARCAELPPPTVLARRRALIDRASDASGSAAAHPPNVTASSRAPTTLRGSVARDRRPSDVPAGHPAAQQRRPLTAGRRKLHRHRPPFCSLASTARRPSGRPLRRPARPPLWKSGCRASPRRPAATYASSASAARWCAGTSCRFPAFSC